MTIGPVVHYDGFTSVSSPGPVQSYISRQQIEDCPYPVYRMSTARAVRYFSHVFHATESQVLEKLPALIMRPYWAAGPCDGLFPMWLDHNDAFAYALY